MVWSLRKKIFIGYGIILILLIVVFAWAFANLLTLGKASEAILTENYKSILAAESMINAIERQDSGILLLLLNHEERGLTQFRENETQFLQWLGRAKDNITVKGESDLLNAIDRQYSSYLVSFSKLRMIFQRSEKGSKYFYDNNVFPLFNSVRNQCIQLEEINQKAMFQASTRAHALSRNAILSMLIIGFAAMTFGLVFSLLLTNLLVRPLHNVMDAAKKVAQGNYEVQVPTVTHDELGQLAIEFNTMVDKLKTYNDMNIEQIISEKRKSEAVIQSIDDGIVVVNSELIITNINPTASAIFNTAAERAQGKHFLETVKNEELFSYMKISVETGQLPEIDEERNVITIKKDDELRYYLFSIVPVYSKQNSLLGVVLLLRNITKLKEVDRLKSEFVMIASHELKTPLTGIGMSIDLLHEMAFQRLNEKEQLLLNSAHEEVQRLKALINSLLDLSKIEAGKVDMEFDKTPLHILFEKAISVLKTQADEKSIELTSSLSRDLPLVKADVNKITWVLTNLISNALRYTESGGHISLFAEQMGNQMQISVTDDGAGIPYEYQSRIFDKFQQLKTDRNGGGSGLGLAICREIVRAHGGTIWVDSKPGEGSTFTFTLQVA
jgi:NtrC-family two-component system sensor histidine kinase KinB